MKILAIETATEACSAALLIDGQTACDYQVEPRRHSELILPMLEGLLADAGLSLGQLDAIAVGNGPGAFTGLRIAIGVAQGVAYSVDLPVIAVSTLAALAQRAYREQGISRAMAAFDARMGEVYWGCYAVEDSLMRSQVTDELAAPETVTVPEGKGWRGVGTGWQTYVNELGERTAFAIDGVSLADLYCSAEDVAILAAAVDKRNWVSAGELVPLYLRNQVAKKPAAAGLF